MIVQPSSKEELSQALRAAHDAGRRVESADLRALDRLLAHTPEDMTVTVEAGLRLSALQATLHQRGQWLPIDPSNPDDLTIGALLATNASGPRRFGHGTIRDYLIGLQAALADGRLIRSGGKVVKNVAGYDLMKLFVGDHGSLGIIVEATFKLLPLPGAEHFVQASRDSLRGAGKLIDAVLDSELTPVVLDLNNAVTHHAPRTTHHVTLGFAGPHEAVEWQLGRARALGFTEPATLEYEAQFHARDLPAPLHASILPSRLIEFIDRLAPEAFVARAGNGVICYRGGQPAPKDDLPVKLIRRVKETFDPKNILPDPPL
jgi:FAD/FMN-containing dehydrogenase